jgi:membrane protein YqaA with SNARE-associated domain
MSTTAIVITVLLASIVGMVVGYIIGRDAGRTEGRDEQWVADFMAAAKRDTERRDARGRFKAKAAL